MRLEFAKSTTVVCFFLAVTQSFSSAFAQTSPMISRATRSTEELCPPLYPGSVGPSQPASGNRSERAAVIPSGREIRRLYDELDQDGTRRQSMEKNIDDAKNDYDQIVLVGALQYQQARDLYRKYMYSHRTQIIISVALEAAILYFSAGTGNVVIKLAQGSPLLLRAATLAGSKTVTNSIHTGATVVLFDATLKSSDFVRTWYNYKNSIREMNNRVYSTHRQIEAYQKILTCYYGLIALRQSYGLNPYYDLEEYQQATIAARLR